MQILAVTLCIKMLASSQQYLKPIRTIRFQRNMFFSSCHECGTKKKKFWVPMRNWSVLVFKLTLLIFNEVCFLGSVWKVVVDIIIKNKRCMVSIWGKNMYEHFSLDIICSLKLTVFLELCSRKTVRILE